MDLSPSSSWWSRLLAEPDIRVIARDGVGFDEGAAVHLAHDPARVHVLEGA